VILAGDVPVVQVRALEVKIVIRRFAELLRGVNFERGRGEADLRR
jgi:hypothetical protein